MLDLTEAFPVRELPTRYPLRRRNGSKLSYSCIWRWINRGVKGTRLQAWRAGSQWITTPQAVSDFFAALGNRDTPSPAEPSPARKKRLEAVRRELERAGI